MKKHILALILIVVLISLHEGLAYHLINQDIMSQLLSGGDFSEIWIPLIFIFIRLLVFLWLPAFLVITLWEIGKAYKIKKET